MKIATTILLTSLAGATAFAQGAAAKKAPPPPPPPPAATKSVPLDINTAKESQLESLPAIGKAKAAAIMKGRPFKGKDELVSKGILSAAEYAKVKDLIIAKQK